MTLSAEFYTYRFPSALRLYTGWPLRTLAVDGWHHSGPRMILWPGFAINTIFYAATLWLLIPGPFALRRLIRRKRGLCVACGYDIRHAEHDVCPECGVLAAGG